MRARLADIVSDPAEPLALTFADAEITEAREPRPDERWFGPAPDAPVPARREGAKLPAGEPLTNVPTLAPRVFKAPPAP
ncbi:MAG: hypothetical protein R3F65_06710 [bacterium]